MKEKEQEIGNRSSVTSGTKKTIQLYVLYTKETIENHIHIMQRNCKVVLMKSLYDKSNFEKKKFFYLTKKIMK